MQSKIRYGAVLVWLACCLPVLAAGEVATPEQAAPDFSALDHEVLVVLAQNQAFQINALEQKVKDLAGKLTASDAALAEAKARCEQSQAVAVHLETELRELWAIIEGTPAAKQQLTDQRRDQQRIEEAIEAEQIVLGMTLEQAQTAMRWEGKLIYETSTEKEYQWERYKEVMVQDPRLRHRPTGDEGRFLTGVLESSPLLPERRLDFIYVVRFIGGKAMDVSKLQPISRE
jgi:hypothetical protein